MPAVAFDKLLTQALGPVTKGMNKASMKASMKAATKAAMNASKTSLRRVLEIAALCGRVKPLLPRVLM